MTKCDEDMDIHKKLTGIDLDFSKIIWVNDIEKALLKVIDEVIIEEYLIERGFQDRKKHINELITAYQELAVEYNITLPTIAESSGESLN